MELIYSVFYFIVKAIVGLAFLYVCQADRYLEEYMDCHLFTLFGIEHTLRDAYRGFMIVLGMLVFDLVVYYFQN